MISMMLYIYTQIPALCTMIPAPINAHDLTAARREWHITPPGWVTAWVLSVLVDPRDLPIGYLFVNVCMCVVPAAVVVLYSNSHVIGVVYMVATIAFFYERFLLALHFSSHRRLTHSSILNAVPEYVLAPFFGLPPGVYKLHHLSVHHKGNNHSEKDFTSTEKYQRDSVLHFAHYWATFVFCVFVRLPLYAYNNGRMQKLRSVVAGFGASACVCCVLYRANPVGVWYVFLLPMVVSSLLTSFGNFCQHLFIDGEFPDRNHALTYSIINSTSNQQSFNDGYHVTHHINSGLHFTQLPIEFHQNLERYAQEGSIVFENTSFFGIGVCVFLHDFNGLARRWVDIGTGKPKTRHEIERLLRKRLRPVIRGCSSE